MTLPYSAHARRKLFICFAIMIPVALLHFVVGPQYRGPYRNFVNGYLIDIILPFAVYFLLTIPKNLLSRKSWLRAGIVFAIGATVETAQYFGLAVLGQTFDPLDYVMYAGGVLCAIIFDKFIFPRILTFWVTE
jgi:hypothetical protein